MTVLMFNKYDDKCTDADNKLIHKCTVFTYLQQVLRIYNIYNPQTEGGRGWVPQNTCQVSTGSSFKDLPWLSVALPPQTWLFLRRQGSGDNIVQKYTLTTKWLLYRCRSETHYGLEPR